jgi:tRNA A-37 threonylcarbamoyl transferase component Bud32
MPAEIDTSLPPRYRNARLLARGGMAEVYRATDGELDREVAVKVLGPRFAADESLRRRFHRESLAAARLSGNPNIVTIFDVGEHDGRPLIVMELLPGGSLERRVAEGAPYTPAHALDWLEEAAAALDAAHAAGIVHRDVKPGNLLLDDQGHVKIADFGVASAAGLASFTQTGTVLGTAGYLSPEQARGERADAASDRYALAVVAWELLTGRRPFQSETATAEAAAHAHAAVPRITDTNPDLPAAYDAIFARALAKAAAARYPTAAEFVGDLRRALQADAGDTWVTPAMPAAPPPPRAARRRWWIPAGLVAVAAAGAAVAALVVARDDGSNGAAATERTIVRTVTGPGRTVERTVTVQTRPAVQTRTATGARSAAALNNEGYSKMQARDYNGALPLLEQAVAKLQGSNAVDEAYADYNLAYTRFALGQCTDVLALLDRSEQVQGHRSEITHLRHEAEKRCGG